MGIEFSHTANVEQAMNNAIEGTNSGKTSWLAAIAIALGKIQGQTAANMINIVDKLDANARDTAKLGDSASDGNKRQSLAAEANVLNGRLQGESQMFKIQSETTSTVVKSIGEGNARVASKT